jgi:hypothetical protein
MHTLAFRECGVCLHAFTCEQLAIKHPLAVILSAIEGSTEEALLSLLYLHYYDCSSKGFFVRYFDSAQDDLSRQSLNLVR